MSTHSLRRPLSPLLPLAILSFSLYLLFFHRLADRDLWSSHEARAAMDAQTVLDDDWALPHLYDGQAELQKPPLYYWLVALCAAGRGGAVDAWAVRLPSALSALACVLLLAALGRRRGRPWLGLAAGMILATTVHFTWLARIGRIDMPLTLAVTVAVLAFHLARPGDTGRPWIYLVAAYLALAAGVLLKGPIGFVLPAAVVGVQRLVDGEVPPPWRLGAWGRLIHGLGLWWGLPLVLALTLPWFVWANLRTGGEQFRVFFWYHNVARGLGAGGLRSHPWYHYLVFLAGDYLPWSPLLPLAGWLWWRHGWGRSDADVRLGLVWFLTVLAVLSLAGFKRSDYLLPAFPGAALFLAGVLCRQEYVGQAFQPDFWVAVGQAFQPESWAACQAGKPDLRAPDSWAARQAGKPDLRAPDSGVACQAGKPDLRAPESWVACQAGKPDLRAPESWAAGQAGKPDLRAPDSWVACQAGKLAALAFVGIFPLVLVFWLVRIEPLPLPAWLGNRLQTLPAQEPYRDYRAFAARVRTCAPAPTPVLFFRTEAHALAFRTGRPLAILVQWPELAAHAARPGGQYVVMPPTCVRECAVCLPGVRLEELARNFGTDPHEHERPLVLVRLSRDS